MTARGERIGNAVSLFSFFSLVTKPAATSAVAFVLISFHVCRRFSSVGTILFPSLPPLCLSGKIIRK